MGKYMRRRKSKTLGDEVSLMEVPSSLGGVLTRAKTLALQRAAAAGSGAGSYIQLRSRRLVKPNSPKKSKENCALEKGKANPSSKLGLRGANSSKLKGDCEKLGQKEEGICKETDVDLGIDEEVEEGSFGENNLLEIEDRGRSTRETTPCNLIRDPDAIRTPGSSTKPTRSSDNKYRVQNTTPRHIPTTSEMDEFFTGPEKQQQRLFIEKYNFDPVNEKPLRGRYEWVKVDSTKKS